MRGCGRQCRGQGRVFVTLVRQTEQPLLALGGSLAPWAHEAQALLRQASPRDETRRGRLLRALPAAREAQRHIPTQSPRLTHGKPLSQYKIVKAYAPPIAPILQGKSNGPAQCGRKTGIVAEPATGCIFAQRVPEGNPRDPSSVLPLLEKVQQALDRRASPTPVPVHSLGGALGIHDPALRHALHTRGMLPVGSPTPVAPLNPTPSQHEVRDILAMSGLQRIRTPHHVHLACASGDSRPVVESPLATLRSRGAAHVRYKGLQGAVVQRGMTVRAHNGAVFVRIQQHRLAKRGQKFRRLLGLKR
jgi:hypothetical protein